MMKSRTDAAWYHDTESGVTTHDGIEMRLDQLEGTFKAWVESFMTDDPTSLWEAVERKGYEDDILADVCRFAYSGSESVALEFTNALRTIAVEEVLDQMDQKGYLENGDKEWLRSLNW
jgi:hypothetical protein